MVRKIITEGINSSGLLGAVVVVCLVLVGWWWLSGGPDMLTPAVTTDQERPSLPQPADIPLDSELVDDELSTVESPGTFGDYDEQFVSNLPPQDRIVLFFTSSRCSACQVTESSIISNLDAIPSDLHILLVDHPTAANLRRIYNVSVPHTFVEIDQDGEKIQSWRASRDLQAILARL